MGMNSEIQETIAMPNNSRLFYSAIASGDYSRFEQADCRILPVPGIYCIFNSGTNMIYVGCSVNVKTRIGTHKSILSANQHICRMMSEDYAAHPELFQIFCIQYVDDSIFELAESIRNHLFALEMQYIKRVPLAILYNALTPSSLSERLLISENPRGQRSIPITEIIARLGMSVDSIRSNNLLPTDVLPIEKAVEFVRKRTVAGGRWPGEKASLAKAYLKEISASVIQSESIEGLLIRGGVMDYFDSIRPIIVPKKVKRIRHYPEWDIIASEVGFVIVLLMHSGLIWYDCWVLWGVPGALGGGVAAFLVVSAIVLMSCHSLRGTSENMLWFIWLIEALAWFVHVPCFIEGADVAYSRGCGIEYIWGLAASVCLCSMAATYFFRQILLEAWADIERKLEKDRKRQK